MLRKAKNKTVDKQLEKIDKAIAHSFDTSLKIRVTAIVLGYVIIVGSFVWSIADQLSCYYCTAMVSGINFWWPLASLIANIIVGSLWVKRRMSRWWFMLTSIVLFFATLFGTGLYFLRGDFLHSLQLVWIQWPAGLVYIVFTVLGFFAGRGIYLTRNFKRLGLGESKKVGNEDKSTQDEKGDDGLEEGSDKDSSQDLQDDTYEKGDEKVKGK